MQQIDEKSNDGDKRSRGIARCCMQRLWLDEAQAVLVDWRPDREQWRAGDGGIRSEVSLVL